MQVRRLRLKRKMKQGDLARAVDVSQGFLCDIEHGYARPSLRVALLLADALGVTLTALVKDGPRAKATERRLETELSNTRGGESTGHSKISKKRPGRVHSTANRTPDRA